MLRRPIADGLSNAEYNCNKTRVSHPIPIASYIESQYRGSHPLTPLK